MSLIVACFLFCGCTQRGTQTLNQAKINHLVFFGLQNQGDRQELIGDCNQKLSSIEGVVSYWCGEHGDFGRDTVDSDYDVSVCFGFDSKEDYACYLKHPAHVEVVQKWKPRWNWIRIHDVVNHSKGME